MYLHIFNQNRIPLQNLESARGFKQIWKSFVPSKVKAHAWRVLWGRLPTKSNLRRWGILGPSDDNRCLLCCLHEESEKHLFFKCSITHSLWMKCFSWLRYSTVIHTGTFTILLSFSRVFGGKSGKRCVVST
ncbi:hypothetical protein ACS0TY_002990 [Phlomoides rotata]